MRYRDITNPNIFDRRILLPLKDTIRLGRKAPNKSGITKRCTHKSNELCDFCSHPETLPYFVVPDKLKEKLGDKPTKLNIMLPKDDLLEVFPKSLSWYGLIGKKCEGNGQEAQYYDEKTRDWVKKTCPCEQLKTDENPKGQCQIHATFYFFLYEITMGGVFRIVMSSPRSINNILNGLELHRDILNRFSLIPLTLLREPTEITYEDDTGRHTRTIYPLKISSDLSLERMAELRASNKEMLLLAGRKQICLPEPADNKEAIEPEIVADEEEGNNTKSASLVTPKSITPLPTAPEVKVTNMQAKKIFALCNVLKLDGNKRKQLMKSLYETDTTKTLTMTTASDFIQRLQDCSDGAATLRYMPDGLPYVEYPPAQETQETDDKKDPEDIPF